MAEAGDILMATLGLHDTLNKEDEILEEEGLFGYIIWTLIVICYIYIIKEMND